MGMSATRTTRTRLKACQTESSTSHSAGMKKIKVMMLKQCSDNLLVTVNL